MFQLIIIYDLRLKMSLYSAVTRINDVHIRFLNSLTGSARHMEGYPDQFLKINLCPGKLGRESAIIFLVFMLMLINREIYVPWCTHFSCINFSI